MKKKIKRKVIELRDIIEEEIKQSSLRQGFSKSLVKYSKTLINKKTNQHKDFTNVPFVTIDGEDSKDFDDAVWAEIKDNKTKVMVAIADVSYYVQQDDPLDVEAKKRGNSFYFPDRVIPMFPFEISNDLCSLVPNEKRKCIIVEVNFINKRIKDFKIHRGIIKSFGRLTYEEVERIYNRKETRNKYFKLIRDLFGTYNLLKKMSEERGKIIFNSNEFKINFKSSEDFEFLKTKRLESYSLIEEFMVLANSIIGNFLKRNKVRSLFRNHEKPPNEKISNLKKIVNDNNIKYSSNFQNQSDFNTFIKKIEKNQKLSFLNEVLLRSQSKAYYNEKNKGHFGLSINDYVHFTSPIRRYSDLVVHRNLISAYFKNKLKKYIDVSDHLNLQEKKADVMERKIMERACSLYLKKIKKLEFLGFIDGVESFGIFIKAIDYPFSGLARYRRNDYEFDRSRNPKYKIGQLVRFRIKKNNIYNGKILLDRVRIMDESF